MIMHTSNVPEDIQWFKGSVQLCQLLQLQFLEVIVIARDVNPTLNDCLDLSKPERTYINFKLLASHDSHTSIT